MPMILRFLHGWAFDNSFWNDVRKLLPPWPAECDDRGYFGSPRSFTGRGPTIAIAHSFGTMRALRDPPANCKGLIAFNGFDRFAARGTGPGVSPRTIDAMMGTLDRSAASVVAKFRRRCGNSDPFGNVVSRPLREDLLALRDLDCSETRLSAPVLSVQGAVDSILDASMRNSCFRTARQVERIEHPLGGHLLPLTHPNYCAEAIRAFVENLR
jgi:pimeloyl-[acyl-carrier protein] methyl ester esterase